MSHRVTVRCRGCSEPLGWAEAPAPRPVPDSLVWRSPLLPGPPPAPVQPTLTLRPAPNKGALAPDPELDDINQLIMNSAFDYGRDGDVATVRCRGCSVVNLFAADDVKRGLRESARRLKTTSVRGSPPT